MRLRYGMVSGPRACVAALALGVLSLLAVAGGASAETYKASNTAQLVEAVSKANANPGANTIVLSSGIYTPESTLILTNTSGLQTVQGSGSAPPSKIEGGAVQPFPSELMIVKASVSATFKNLMLTTGGGNGVPSIDDFGNLTVESSLVAGNNGGGIHVEPSASATVKNTTISDGLDFGLIDNGTASLINSTVAFNEGGGIENKHTLSLTNTIVANNKGAGDCVGSATTSDHSLDSDGSCGVGALSNMNPLLGKLVNNGGPTPTRALERESPAIDAADKAACPTTDQRGFKRPDVASTACDVGAFEFYTPPHWYENHSPLEKQSGEPGEEGTQTLIWGSLAFTAPEIGEVNCQTEWGGSVFNPEGAGGQAGPGEINVKAFQAYNCTSTVCETTLNSKLAMLPEGLGVVSGKALAWKGTLAEPQPGLLRLKVGNTTAESPTKLKLHIVCAKTTGGEYNKSAQGELAPQIENGTAIGSAPSKLTFNSGQLEVGTEKATVTGKVKMMGFEGGEIITVKGP